MDRTQNNDHKGYAFIRNHVIHTGVTPSLRVIGKAVGYVSPRSVQLMLERLAKQGLISYVDGVIKIAAEKVRVVSEQVVAVPLVGSVACGLPSLAEQEPEALIQVSTRIAHPGGSYFLLRARGTSMNKSGINDGDLVLVRQQPTANEGDKVVALINDEATVKHLHQEKGMVVLKPNSTDKSHKPIVLSDQFAIQGVVAATLPANLY